MQLKIEQIRDKLLNTVGDEFLTSRGTWPSPFLNRLKSWISFNNIYDLDANTVFVQRLIHNRIIHIKNL